MKLEGKQRAEAIKAAVTTFEKHDSDHPEYTCAVIALAVLLDSGDREVLSQLVKTGPVWDGDIASKAHRGNLFDYGLASRALVKGEWGYTVANYLGGHVHKAIEELGNTE